MFNENFTLGDRFNFYSSDNINFPVITSVNADNGKMLQVLDMCLIDGSPTVDIVSMSKENDIITINYYNDHQYLPRQLIEISGANEPLLNGEFRIIESPTTKQIKIKNTNNITDFSGTIKTKLVSLNWESIFGSSNALKRAYRSKSPISTKKVLYLDMQLPAKSGTNSTNPAKVAMITVCQDMKNIGEPINDLTSIFNAKSTSNTLGNLKWIQSASYAINQSSSSKFKQSWFLIGNETYFLFFMKPSTYDTINNQSYYAMYGYGDFTSYSGSYDKYNTFLFYEKEFDYIYSGVGGRMASSYNEFILVRNYDGIGDVKIARLSISGSYNDGTITTGLSPSFPTYPNPSNLSVFAKKIDFIQSDYTNRGYLNRLFFIANNIPSNMNLKLDDNIMYISVQAYQSGSSEIYSSYGLYLGD